ncbi:MAG: hypothetical protein M3O36_14100 [Myxococcota bacterium]|nr:hypothetical protein [Myxococcota bacterium]
MGAGQDRRFPIRFDGWYEPLSSLFFLPPESAFVEVTDDEVVARMGWAFLARFPRAAVASASPMEKWVASRGVHGWAGRWLVNGSAAGLLAIRLVPGQEARVMGLAVSLRELIVSVEDPAALSAAVSTSAS